MINERFIGKSNEVYIPICDKCIHCIDNKFSCKAFPKGIPDEILDGSFDHTKKHPLQDNDVVFEEIKKD